MITSRQIEQWALAFDIEPQLAKRVYDAFRREPNEIKLATLLADHKHNSLGDWFTRAKNLTSNELEETEK